MSLKRRLRESDQELPLLQRILKDFDQGEQDGREAEQQALQNKQLQRERLFPLVEKAWQVPGRLIAFIAKFGREGCEIEEKDITAIGSMLKSIGTVPNLSLMIHSPGGSGETAEKIVDMCRNHCSDTFRVIVPNKAKSAATLISFAADAIVMGYCSELGPIDPQFYVVVSNVPHQISALSILFRQGIISSRSWKSAVPKVRTLPVILLNSTQALWNLLGYARLRGKSHSLTISLRSGYLNSCYAEAIPIGRTEC